MTRTLKVLAAVALTLAFSAPVTLPVQAAPTSGFRTGFWGSYEVGMFAGPYLVDGRIVRVNAKLDRVEAFKVDGKTIAATHTYWRKSGTINLTDAEAVSALEVAKSSASKLLVTLNRWKKAGFKPVDVKVGKESFQLLSKSGVAFASTSFEGLLTEQQASVLRTKIFGA